MKLACLRCKRKKIKCDKGNPICHQCITASTTCQYVERRRRPRLTQQRETVPCLNYRLELLEKQIANSGTGEQRSPFSPLTVPSGPVNEDTSMITPSSRAFMNDNAQESWIYRMATDARRKFQSQTTPVSTPTPRIDDEMSSLNDALKDLGNLKIRPDLTATKINLDLSTGELRQCVDIFVDHMGTMVVPDIFATALDVNLIRMLPDIVDSPYVRVDPSAYVMYYNAVHYGLYQLRGPGDARTQEAYLSLLRAVPTWLDANTETDMDGYTAALTSWTAINNLDYQLSWKFHCKSCHFIKVRGIDDLDVAPARNFEEENAREATRYLYWHILSTDCLFRLFFGKPTVLSWSPNKVRPPAVFTHRNVHPSASQVMIAVVWVQYTLRTVKIINYLDSHGLEHCDTSVVQKVNDFCTQLEDLMAEWDMEARMKAESSSHALRCLIADHIMNIYAIIIGIKRLARPTDPAIVHPIILRAARKMVATLLYFEGIPALPDTTKFTFAHFISFYPFCAVFSLYEHILACTDPEDCEQDVQSLESIGDAMANICAVRLDFTPFAKTIMALNKVSRAIQDERRNQRTDVASTEIVDHLANTQQQFQNLANYIPTFDSPAFGVFSDFPMNMEGDMAPLDFVRALENDLIGKNWHENRWDMEGGMSGM
ncbi:hypothetical protein P153DRAFT_365077 [Dothidotthia symphoricarpi CBS 119687]|uniref:Zn(2)-C6 fungal-type domain-containing protein n=1 Tax=Dothidotthia symphoricarpi CBS 119687 TaxID=1392245 RepID=A0A6A6AK61_9PLEO|nr:uncharacterized protein P153DRAFT_365077 [Dothidotthia symphoricarpi CBS 119687]KAF2131498.1 hypothetical protein P153DRAFT_365077 [Dothidotthia symphoricarpi CBS 119687]